jgi:hypothetical protein
VCRFYIDETETETESFECHFELSIEEQGHHHATLLSKMFGKLMKDFDSTI